MKRNKWINNKIKILTNEKILEIIIVKLTNSKLTK